MNVRTDSYDVYVGRGGKGFEGQFGNPFRPGVLDGVEGVGTTLRRYRAYFVEKVRTEPTFREAVATLRGKRLGCFCAPVGGITAKDTLICHGQVIAAYLDGEDLVFERVPQAENGHPLFTSQPFGEDDRCVLVEARPTGFVAGLYTPGSNTPYTLNERETTQLRTLLGSSIYAQR